jgi:hypothetical protein
MKAQYIKIDECNNTYYYADKEMIIFHREDGPAIEYADGDKAWFLNGKYHREDGPALEWATGYKEWHLNGKWLTEKEFNQHKKTSAYCNGKIVEIDGNKHMKPRYHIYQIDPVDIERSTSYTLSLVADWAISNEDAVDHNLDLTKIFPQAFTILEVYSKED